MPKSNAPGAGEAFDLHYDLYNIKNRSRYVNERVKLAQFNSTVRACMLACFSS